jgi:DNA-binding transcriptional regulator YiaG
MERHQGRRLSSASKAAATGESDARSARTLGRARSGAGSQASARAGRREFEPVDVREIRRIFGQTRAQFATMIGISKETLRNWERGRRYPLGSARALLRIAKADPDVAAAVLVRNLVTWGRVDPTDGT